MNKIFLSLALGLLVASPLAAQAATDNTVNRQQEVVPGGTELGKSNRGNPANMTGSRYDTTTGANTGVGTTTNNMGANTGVGSGINNYGTNTGVGNTMGTGNPMGGNR